MVDFFTGQFFTIENIFIVSGFVRNTTKTSYNNNFICLLLFISFAGTIIGHLNLKCYGDERKNIINKYKYAKVPACVYSESISGLGKNSGIKHFMV